MGPQPLRCFNLRKIRYANLLFLIALLSFIKRIGSSWHYFCFSKKELRLRILSDVRAQTLSKHGFTGNL